MAISQAVLTNSAAPIYTSSGSSATTAIFFMNNDATARTIDVYVVPSGGSATAATQIIKGLSIDAGDTYVLNLEKLVLDNGDAIEASASVGSQVTATISYIAI